MARGSRRPFLYRNKTGSNSCGEYLITSVSLQGNHSFHAGSSSSNSSHDINKRRSDFFHIRVVSKHTKIETIFYSGSRVKSISELIVKKLGLETRPHPRPYPLGSVCDNAILMSLSSVGSDLLWNQI